MLEVFLTSTRLISEAKHMNRKNEKLGSDLVVQRSRYHNFEVVFRDQQDGHSFSGIGSIEAVKLDFHNLYHG